jgi:hypothetical protein
VRSTGFGSAKCLNFNGSFEGMALYPRSCPLEVD